MITERSHCDFSHFYLPTWKAAAPSSDPDNERYSSYRATKLAIPNTEMQDADVDALIQAFQESIDQHKELASVTILESLDVSCNSISPKGIHTLLRALIVFSKDGVLGSFRSLCLDWAPFCSDSTLVEECVELAIASSSLREVILSHSTSTSLGEPPEEAKTILWHVQLNFFPAAVKAALVRALKNDSSLRTMDLSSPPTPQDLAFDPPKQFSIACTQAVVDTLVRCHTVTALDFSSNCQGDANAKIIASLILHNSNLREIALRSNNITTVGGLEMVRALRDTKNETLTELDMKDNGLSNVVAEELLTVISQGRTSLGLIHFDNNCVTNEVVSRLHQSLMLNTQPRKLKEYIPLLQTNSSRATRIILNSDLGLTDNSIRVLLHAVRANSVITHIDVSNNELTDEGGWYLAEMIEGNKSLKKVVAQFNHIGTKGATKIVEAIPTNSNIELVDLKHQTPPLPESVLSAIFSLAELSRQPRDLHSKGLVILNNDPSLTALQLDTYDGKNRCTDATLRILEVMLAGNTCLRELSVGNNQGFVTEQSIPVLVGLIPRLSLLDISNLKFTDENVAPIVATLFHTNSGLVTLIMDGNELTFKTAQKIIKSLKTVNDTLTRVSLQVNPGINVEDQDEVAFLCGLNYHSKAFKSLVLSIAENDRSIEEVNFSQVVKSVDGATSYVFSREFDDRSAFLVCTALGSNKHVTKLNFSGQAVTNKGAVAFARLLRTNSTLTHLDISYNRIGNEGLEHIAKALMENRALKVLVCNGNESKDPKIQKVITVALQTNETAQTSIYSDVHNPHPLGDEKDPKLRAAHVEKLLENAIMDDAMADLNRKKKLH